MKTAVCVIIRSKKRVFAVSRRNDQTQWGFVGGKVDPGESHCDAVVRETFEEIGVKLVVEQLVPIFSGFCEGADGNHFWVTTYLYTQEVDEASFTESLTLEEGIAARFMNNDDLCMAKHSPFNFYNLEAFSSMDAYLYES